MHDDKLNSSAQAVRTFCVGTSVLLHVDRQIVGGFLCGRCSVALQKLCGSYG